MRATRVAVVYLVLTLASTWASASPTGDEECLACHGQAGMKSDAGKSISIDPAKHAASAHAVLGCKDCHTSIKEFPHPAKIAKVKCATCHADEAKSLPHQRPLHPRRIRLRFLSWQRARTHHRRKTDARKMRGMPWRRTEGARIQHPRAGRENTATPTRPNASPATVPSTR